MSERATGWRSYDSVAELYARVAESRFAPLARDLVRAAAPTDGDVVLDVGCGTGLVARSISDTRRAAFVVGVDPSVGMLRLGTRRVASGVVAGIVPGLPFPVETFDVIFANLVLSHVSSVDAALVELRTVLRTNGRIASSAWGVPLPAGSENQQIDASEVVDDVRRQHGLMIEDDAGWPVPWEDRFRAETELWQIFESAGLDDIRITAHVYREAIPVPTFVAGTEWGARGRYLRERTSDQAWFAVRAQIVDELHARFGDSIKVTDSYWIALAHRAAD